MKQNNQSTTTNQSTNQTKGGNTMTIKLLPTHEITTHNYELITQQIQDKYPNYKINNCQAELIKTFTSMPKETLPKLKSNKILTDYYGNQKLETLTGTTITLNKYNYLKNKIQYQRKTNFQRTITKVSYYQAYHQEHLLLPINTIELETDRTDSGTNKTIQYGQYTNKLSKLTKSQFNIIITFIKDQQLKHYNKELKHLETLGKQETNPQTLHHLRRQYVYTIQQLKALNHTAQYTKLKSLTLIDTETLNTFPIKHNTNIDQLFSDITATTLEDQVNKDTLIKEDPDTYDITEDYILMANKLDIDLPTYTQLKQTGNNGYSNHYSRYYQSEDDKAQLKEIIHYYIDNNIIDPDQYQQAYRDTVLYRLNNDQDYTLTGHLLNEYNRLPDYANIPAPKLAAATPTTNIIDRTKYEAFKAKYNK